MFKRLLLRLSIAIFCLSLPFIDTTNAVFTDSAQIDNNQLSTGNWTPPSTILTLSGSWSRGVEERVQNPSFEAFDPVSQKPNIWVSNGDVAVVGSEHSVVPQDGNYMVKIGREDDPGNNLYINSISQTLPNNTKNISFWYNFFSYDYAGFDEPGFSVYLNGKEIYQIWAKDINGVGWPNNSGWQQFFYDISHLDAGAHPLLTLIFYAGNTDDENFQSWVYLDQVSTKDVTVGSETKFHLEATDDTGSTGVVTYWQPGCGGSPIAYDGFFSLNASLPSDQFCFWSVDAEGNEEVHKSIHAVFDNTPPLKVEDLEVTDYGDGGFTLNWTAPADDQNHGQAVEYDLRYSTATISAATAWDLLPKVATVSAPRKAGELEWLEINNLEQAVPYWFAVKASDAAPNWSALSNVVTNGSTLVINEVYYDVGSGKGSEPANEWLEIYNNAGYDVNLKDWQITDNSGTKRKLSATDLFLPAGKFAVVTKEATTWTYWIIPADVLQIVLGADWNPLANASDRVELYSPTNRRIDEISYGDDHAYFVLPDVADGHSLARKIKGVDTNQAGDWEDLSIPNPGTNPHSAPPTPSSLETEVDFYLSSDKKSVGFKAGGISPYTNLKYEITYSPTNREPQGIMGTAELNGENELAREGFVLGTDSSGDWVYDEGIERIHLKVVLTGAGIPDRTLEKDLVY